MNKGYSIIIPTKNRCDQLIECLKSIELLFTDGLLFEVLVIDNNSNDLTRNILQLNFKMDIRYFLEEIPGLLSARHFGAKMAKYDILCFLDDDVILSKNWLIGINKSQLNHPDYSLFTGPTLPIYESPPPSWLKFFFETNNHGDEFCGWLSLMNFGLEDKEINPKFVWGLNFIIRKNAYAQLKGFHPDNIDPQYQMYQGDGESGLTRKAMAAGMKAWYSPDILLHHVIPKSRLTVDYFKKRAYYQGVCDSFTEIRLQFFKQQENKKYRTLSHKINYLLKRIVDIFQSKLYARKINNQFILMNNEYKSSYTQGKNDHLNSFNKDEKVKIWVLKEDYQEYNFLKNI
jgi:glycosyltransferase involved in cell wall biosynthesis